MKRTVSVLCLILCSASAAPAAPIAAGTTVIPTIAFQDITLLPNTPFNPTPNPIFLDDVFGVGNLVLNRSTQVGSTIQVPSLSGIYFGSHPALGSFVFGTVAPLTAADFNAVISNVVQDPLSPGFSSGDPSSFVSGDAVFAGNSFGFQFLSGPATGITLFTDPAVPFSFTSTLNGLPPSIGTVLQNSGANFLNVTFNGIPVATSSDRRIISLAIPEPSSLAALGFCTLGTLAWRRRRQRKSVEATLSA